MSKLSRRRALRIATNKHTKWAGHSREIAAQIAALDPAMFETLTPDFPNAQLIVVALVLHRTGAPRPSVDAAVARTKGDTLAAWADAALKSMGR